MEHLRVYYDFPFPKGKGREHGLFRNYFKYDPEELQKAVAPIFRHHPLRLTPLNVARKLHLKAVKRLSGMPYILYLEKQPIDLMHLLGTFAYKSTVPWVSEIESVDQYAGSFDFNPYEPSFVSALRTLLENRFFRHLIVNCRVVAKSFSAIGIQSDKITILYPAISPGTKKTHVNRKSKPIKLLFNFGTHPLFFFKGGREITEAFSRLRTDYNIRLTIIGKDSIDKIKPFLTPGAEYLGFVSKEELYSYLYPESDIFVHPTHMDAFPYSVLEAMSFGLPVITTSHYALPEVILDRVNGIIYDDIETVWYDRNYIGRPNYRSWMDNDAVTYVSDEYRTQVDRLTSALRALIEDSELREECSANNYQTVLKGTLSISARNSRLLEIYNDTARM
ncbi:MAG: glycosyltransferase family 4 protein [Spirochaetales bacterium]|nr:glycosyltransferase family 4 protein [Spirochaetales bacterium]